MPTCRFQYDSDRLALLLSGDLPEADQAELADHLESCEPCRKALDALSARSGLWADLALLREPSTGGDAEADAESRDVEAEAIALLERSDDPGVLGRLGPYDLLRVIGRGGMGVVFQGVDRGLDRPVAIKVLAPALAVAGAARRRFAREGKAAAAVVHEHVVAIHAVDATAQGVPFLVMEYVAGRSAQDLVDVGRSPEPAEILRIGSQAARGLAAAHAQGLIHRDVKPANILLEDGVERVKITDFGLARAVDDASMTQSGVIAGTPQYMSPEQARGEPVDHRTDLFSLGSVLYALCTGWAPFRGSSSLATLRRVSEQEPEPIPSINPGLPAWLVSIIARLHAKRPADRFQSAEEVADLLGRCLAHVQQPGSVPLPCELAPRPRRRRLVAWGTLAACVMLAASLSISEVRAAAQEAADSIATVLRLKTPSGLLVIQTDDPEVSIRLDGSDLIVTGAGVRKLRLDVGRHNVEAIKDGRVIREELVTITRGDRTVLSIRREPEGSPAVADWRELYEERLRAESSGRLGGPDPGRPPDKPPSTATKKDRESFDGLMKDMMSMRDRAPDLRAEPPGDERLTIEPIEPIGGADAFSFPEAVIEARRLAEALERHPAEPTRDDGRPRMQVYMRDLEGDRVTLVADEPISGQTWTSMPDWSPDGTRIAFHTCPDDDWQRSQIVLLERDPGGMPKSRSLGPGSHPSFSPDGRMIAFFQWPGTEGGAGVWLMLADGSGRRRISDGVTDAPSWSPDGGRLLLNPFSEPTKARILDLETGHLEAILVPGFEVISWPAWVDARTLVATLNTGPGRGDERLALLDVSKPSDARIIRSRWTRGEEQDFLPRWPTRRPLSDEFYFSGVSDPNLRNLYRLTPDQSDRAVPMQPRAREDSLHGLTFSPDGRYLLFSANRPDRQPVEQVDEGSDRVGGGLVDPRILPPGGDPRLSPEAEVEHLARILRTHPAEPSEDDGRDRMMLSMMDLETGRGMPIADEPLPGLLRSSMPDWSPDGRRIVFHTWPDNDWRRAQLKVLRAEDGAPAFRDLGPGDSPAYSPDGGQIAFILWPGLGPEPGVYVMDADGSDRRRVADTGAPYWSPDGDRLLINSQTEPTRSRILDLGSGREQEAEVPGVRLISWPRWVDDRTLVAVVNTGEGAADERIVLLDVTDPARSEIRRELWERGPGQDFVPRWPLPLASTDEYVFVGVAGSDPGGEGERRALYRLSPASPGRAIPMEPRGHRGRLGGLNLSPDGRYLLFQGDRPDRGLVEPVDEDADREVGVPTATQPPPLP